MCLGRGACSGQRGVVAARGRRGGSCGFGAAVVVVVFEKVKKLVAVASVGRLGWAGRDRSQQVHHVMGFARRLPPGGAEVIVGRRKRQRTELVKDSGQRLDDVVADSSAFELSVLKSDAAGGQV